MKRKAAEGNPDIEEDMMSKEAEKQEAEKQEAEPRQGISKVKLAVGAAGLLLFIVGVKRSFRLADVSVEDTRLARDEAEEPEDPQEPVRESLLGGRRR